ncbi:hypothetical protein [Empedobacter falsenii]|uniref:Glycosyltransferase family 2 protein n=1 Tax=Empedobacter falsenii TaxID=343874 RepID=A0A427BQ94_9FLAO|nr:hypothetical protein [Empedobacter falsenii]RRT92659.1 hypothetical protein EGI89_05195 [Empedobacter falsenii]RRT92815.1 hypothetical protein EGI88_05630 [Empedobacter falsenii]
MLKQRIKNSLHLLFYKYLTIANPLIKSQRKNPLTIPVLIINFNQLFYLKQLVEFLLERGFQNIIIIDNKSSYKPLLDYYSEIEGQVVIKVMKENYGHNVLYLARKEINEYTKGYFIITDPDIIPNENLPHDFLNKMIEYLEKYFNKISKVGFALRINDIPDYFSLKDKVLNWEKKFWDNKIENNCYLSIIDTTFALYKPNYPYYFYNISFLPGLRVAGDFIAKHGGWYKDPNNLTQEELFYQKTANSSSSWNFDKDNKVLGNINY